jgi:lysophospholipase L1-like esterase
MLQGDSKTANDTWVANVANSLRAQSPAMGWYTKNAGAGGTTVATAAAAIATTLAAMPATTEPVRVLMNWGANDVAALPAEATWETNYLTIIDATLVKWPQARIYLMRPWRQSFDTESDTLATRIGHLVAARPASVFLGPDERVWLKGSDNGVSETTDGVHYNALGTALAAAAWTAVLQ